MAKLYLIRHGLPELPGDEPVCLGAADAPLSREGREQMKGLREFVRRAGIRRIYVSDLVRSRESGEILSGGEIPVIVREELRENSMGEWETLTFREIRERFPEEYRRRGEDMAGYAPAGGESFRDCQRRAMEAYRRILSEMDGNTAVVGHVGFFRSLICALEGRDLRKLMDIALPCGGVYEWPVGPALGAVILAAGRSSRMGALKPLLPVPGGTILSREIGLLARAGVRRVVVVTGHEAERITAECAGPGVEFVHNGAFASTGMIDSLRLGLSALPEETEGAFVLPADAPGFTLFTLRREMEAFASGGADVIRPTAGGKPGHPLLLRRSFFPLVRDFDGREGLRGLLSRHGERVLDLALPEPGLVMDADTPEDYRRLLDYMETEVPDRDRCREIWDWAGLSPALRRHSAAVADKAEEMARALIAAGRKIDLRTVTAAALLHDVSKGRPGHGRTGAAWLRELGLPRAADAVERHADLPERKTVTPEELVVFLADKHVLGDRPCTVPERYQRRLEEFGADPEAAAAIRRRWEQAEKWNEYYHLLLQGGQE
ncbi:MAG: histidine phosphatase family protein [Oscillospiraceae bacterium]|nr:histidine phosphatase family protein [Oscillospiraceae bacterium]